ncbi:hypothetical protein K523DRAFT_131636 [Schizophyllum commune Tattone D]|nr:hypothetical protein K523DRAFT_131636 [Schizophyllum commune Tattone D]
MSIHPTIHDFRYLCLYGPYPNPGRPAIAKRWLHQTPLQLPHTAPRDPPFHRSVRIGISVGSPPLSLLSPP